ncbi:MAG: nucleotidyltransferase [Hadesarchaea archaeon]|nr:MAG: nucleotidyltransferase [Hadesarchaea archaeon]
MRSGGPVQRYQCTSCGYVFREGRRTVEEIRRVLAEHRREMRERYGVASLGLFGSFARGEQTEVSDVDILVEFERPIGLKFLELADYLEKILGMRVDLLTARAVKQKPELWVSVREELIRV